MSKKLIALVGASATGQSTVETMSEKGAIYIRTEKVSHVLVLWLIGAMKKYWHISIITI